MCVIFFDNKGVVYRVNSRFSTSEWINLFGDLYFPWKCCLMTGFLVEGPCAIKLLIRLLPLMNANTFSRCYLCLCHHLDELCYLFPSSFATLTGSIEGFFIFPEIENLELHVSIFINVSTIKNKVKRDSNWAEILLVKQSLKNNHLS